MFEMKEKKKMNYNRWTDLSIAPRRRKIYVYSIFNHTCVNPRKNEKKGKKDKIDEKKRNGEEKKKDYKKIVNSFTDFFFLSFFLSMIHLLLINVLFVRAINDVNTFGELYFYLLLRFSLWK